MVQERALGEVRWIGGGSGADKSTVARRLAVERGATLYDTDAAMDPHVQRLGERAAPRLHRFLRMDMDERWVARSASDMLASFHWFAGEGFDLVVDDLAGLTPHGAVVAEGFRLLPQMVAPLLDDARDAVWLLPTPAFRRMAFEQRGSLWSTAEQTTDPQRALDNLLERDRLFTDRIRAEIAELGLVAIDVDVGEAENDVYTRVAQHLRP